MTAERKIPDGRKEALAKLIASQLSQGRRIETQSGCQAVLVQGHRVNHVLHLIPTLATAGLWVIVWVALALLWWRSGNFFPWMSGITPRYPACNQDYPS